MDDFCWSKRFLMTTPIWIQGWLWNDTHTFYEHGRGSLLLYEVICQISSSQGPENIFVIWLGQDYKACVYVCLYMCALQYGGAQFVLSDSGVNQLVDSTHLFGPNAINETGLICKTLSLLQKESMTFEYTKKKHMGSLFVNKGWFKSRVKSLRSREPYMGQ